MMVTVRARKIAPAAMLLAALCFMGGCSREQQDWRAAESTDTLGSYGRFIEQHPESELVTQARTRMTQLGEDRDWKRAGSADTAAAYQEFLGQHPSGKWAQEARIRVQNFALGIAAQPLQSPPVAGDAVPPQSSTMARTATSPPASAVPVAAAEGFSIQLGAFSSEDRAHAEWQALQGRFPPQLQGLTPQVVAADTASGRVYRLQARAADEARARLICAELRTQSQGCVPVVPH